LAEAARLPEVAGSSMPIRTKMIAKLRVRLEKLMRTPFFG
jgi:hypothetical protein